MPVIPLIEKVRVFRTEKAIALRACRGYVEVEFAAKSGNTFRRSAVVDLGAPFSVIPYSLWHDKDIPWQPLGAPVTGEETAQPSPLSWFGVPCQMGDAQVWLVDAATEIRSRLLRVRAKLPSARVSSHAEKEVILGYDFLAANAITLRCGQEWAGLTAYCWWTKAAFRRFIP